MLAQARARDSTIFQPSDAPAATPMAVVDPELRVHGVSGLRVADARVMPTVVSGNANAACIMIGEKCADMMLAMRSAQPRGRGALRRQFSPA